MNELRLIAGQFYKARNGSIWCCIRVGVPDKKRPAICVRVEDAPLSCTAARFFENGRRNEKEEDTHDLLENVPRPLFQR